MQVTDVRVRKIEKEGKMKGVEGVIITDLPGIYSLSPYTLEEVVARNYLITERPDVILNIVDASNPERNLYLTTQLIELGIPVVVALNKSDINSKKETKIDTDTLSKLLSCPVIETVSTSADGLKAVIEAAVKQAGTIQEAVYNQGDVDLTNKKAVENNRFFSLNISGTFFYEQLPTSFYALQRAFRNALFCVPLE